MNTRRCLLTWFALFYVLSSYGHCLAEDQATTLTVKKIVIKIHKSGKETVAVLCNQACVPALFGLEGKKPKIFMDFTGVFYIDPKYRNVPVSGKYVKKLRSHLDPASKKLRIVLVMNSSKNYVVHPKQNLTTNTYSLVISEKRRVKGKYAKKSPKTKYSSISIIDQERKPIDKGLKPAETALKHAPLSDASITEEEISAERGRSQMNAGNYTGAINTFTKMIANNPKDSLPYRLRGNAYQNMGNLQKAVGDWITAARLGDKIIQSYLDAMKIDWKEVPNS